MHPTLVILVVGLAPNLVGAHTPNLKRFAERGGLRPLDTVTPAVTCTVQSTLLTGLPPSGHGAVANGWYFRDLSEVWLWRQSNRLIAGEKIWEAARKRDPDFTCAKMFWWYNMYATVDWSATPRPMYPADGRKIPDHYAHPSELRDELDGKLISLLQSNGRASNIELAKRVGVSEGTIRRRFRKLMKDEVIRVVAIPDPTKLGRGTTALIGLKVDHALVDPVATDLAKIDEVQYVAVTTGAYDVFIWIALGSPEELSSFLRNQIGIVPGVRRTETFVNLSIKKSPAGPSAVRMG